MFLCRVRQVLRRGIVRHAKSCSDPRHLKITESTVIAISAADVAPDEGVASVQGLVYLYHESVLVAVLKYALNSSFAILRHVLAR